MSDITRSKMDILYQDVFRDLNELLNRVEMTEAQMTTTAAQLDEKLQALTSIHMSLNHDIEDLQHQSSTFIRGFADQQSGLMMTKMQNMAASIARAELTNLQRTIETTGAQAAYKVLNRAVRDGLNDSMSRMKDILQQIQGLSNDAEYRIRKAADAVTITWVKRVILPGVSMFLGVLLALAIFRIMELRYPALSSDDQHNLIVGRKIEAVWSGLDQTTRNSIVSAIEKTEAARNKIFGEQATK